MSPESNKSKENDGPEVEELYEELIDPTNNTQTTFIGAGFTNELREKIDPLLEKDIRSFAWSHADMIGINPETITHKLNIDSEFKPIKQKRRKVGTERNKVINDEVSKLLENGLIKEVQYPDWLANTIVVPKKNGKMRACIDFTDLN